jgi:hypothetical protein
MDLIINCLSTNITPEAPNTKKEKIRLIKRSPEEIEDAKISISLHGNIKPVYARGILINNTTIKFEDPNCYILKYIKKMVRLHKEYLGEINHYHNPLKGLYLKFKNITSYVKDIHGNILVGDFTGKKVNITAKIIPYDYRGDDSKKIQTGYKVNVSDIRLV